MNDFLFAWPFGLEHNNMMMRHGKHRGHSFAEVAQMDRSYCSWVLRSEPGTFMNFHKYLKKTHRGILEMGRHKGMFFDDLFASQQDYCRWVMNLEDPGAGFHKLIDWLKKKHSQEEAPAATSAATHTAEPVAKKFKSEECKICYDKVIDSVFVPCGHVAACITCADKLEACPICQIVCVAFKMFHA